MRKSKTDTLGVRVNWPHIKWLIFTKEAPGVPQNMTLVKTLEVRISRARQDKWETKGFTNKIKWKAGNFRCKIERISVSYVKQDLFQANIMISANASRVDRLPEPDAEEEDYDTYQDWLFNPTTSIMYELRDVYG